MKFEGKEILDFLRYINSIACIITLQNTLTTNGQRAGKHTEPPITISAQAITGACKVFLDMQGQISEIVGILETSITILGTTILQIVMHVRATPKAILAKMKPKRKNVILLVLICHSGLPSERVHLNNHCELPDRELRNRSFSTFAPNMGIDF